MSLNAQLTSSSYTIVEGMVWFAIFSKRVSSFSSAIVLLFWGEESDSETHNESLVEERVEEREGKGGAYLPGGDLAAIKKAAGLGLSRL